jgi:hypothetical protein
VMDKAANPGDKDSLLMTAKRAVKKIIKFPIFSIRVESHRLDAMLK